VTRNEGSDAINHILDHIPDNDFKLTESIYDQTFKALAKMADSERMLFDVRMRLCSTYFNRKSYDEALSLCDKCHKTCLTSDGSDDKKNKGAELLEIYALQLRISAATGNSTKLKELFEKTKDVVVAVQDPRSQSVIRECWGTMFGEEGQWVRAKQEFYTAFLNYDQSGDAPKAKQCLKYVVIANMLSNSDANVFDAREPKSYEKDKEIEAVSSIRAAFDKCDVAAFTRCLDEINKAKDPFITKHLESMITNFNSRAIVMRIKSYRRIRLQSLADYLRVQVDKVEELLVHLILDNAVMGKIDQVNGILDLSATTGGGGKKYSALQEWTGTLSTLVQNLNQPSVQ